MKEEIKDPALGTIVENKIKVTAEPGEPTIHVREKSPKGNPYKLAIVIMSIIIFALIAGILYLLFCPLANPEEDRSSDDQTSQTCPEQTVCEDTLKAETAVKAVVDKVRQSIIDVMQDNKQTNYQIIQTYDTGASYQPEGYITGVPLTKSYGVALNSENLEAGQTLYNLVNNFTIYQAIENTLVNAGFINTNQQYTTSSAGRGSTSFVNQADGIVCSVSTTGADCGYKTWYDEADAELSNKLAQIYKDTTNKDARYLVARVQDIKDSPIAPYQRIEVGMPGFAASFYRISPDAEWQFFTEGQSAPQCSEYSTDDLRKAFAGTSCFPSTTGPMETVQP